MADAKTSSVVQFMWTLKQMAYPMYTLLFAVFIAPLSLLFFGHALAYLAIVVTGVAGLLFSGGAIVLAFANRYGRKPALVRARLARALATAVEAGLPLGRAIRLAADASADPAVQKYVQSIDERTLSGQPIATTLSNCPHMTPDFLAVLQVAERTGEFSGSIGRLAAQYEDGFR